MKRAANTYSARTYSAIAYAPTTASRVFWWVPRIPSHVWLAMIILTVSALSISTFLRARAQEREARDSYSYTKTKVENAKSANQQMRKQTQQIRNNPQAAARAAQDRLRLLRANEVVVAAP